jgi:hypothetical protein
MIAWVLFLVIGIFLFFPPVNPNARVLLMILFFVLMIVWLIFGFGPWDVPIVTHRWVK